MEFDWDDAKDEWLRRERGFGFADVLPIFDGRLVEWEDTRRDYGETRVVAVGLTAGRFFTAVYTDRGSIRWLITAWPSNRKERARWPG